MAYFWAEHDENESNVGAVVISDSEFCFNAEIDRRTQADEEKHVRRNVVEPVQRKQMIDPVYYRIHSLESTAQPLHYTLYRYDISILCPNTI